MELLTLPFRVCARCFEVVSFPLARAGEEGADRRVAAIVGASSLAEALVAREVATRFERQIFWPDLRAREGTQAETPAPSRALARVFGEGIALEAVARLCDEALAAPHEPDDPLPGLAERLKVLGRPAVISAPPRESAAQRFLGETEERLIDRLDREWWETAGPWWRRAFAEREAAREGLARLEARPEAATLTPEERWDRAWWTRRLLGDSAALPLLREVLAVSPDHAWAHLALGEILLADRDAAGLPHIESAIRLDAELFLMGSMWGESFLTATGQPEERERFRTRMSEEYGDRWAALLAWFQVRPTDTFQCHDLPEVAVALLRAELARHSWIEGAYLVVRPPTPPQTRGLLVLGIVPDRRHYWLPSRGDEQPVERGIDDRAGIEGGFHCKVCFLDRRCRRLRRALTAAPGAWIEVHPASP